MSKVIIIAFSLLSLWLSACSGSGEEITISQTDFQSGKLIVVDVRTAEEWNYDGHADCSVNFPLDQLSSHLDTIRKFDKVIVVCRSGNRAGSAREMLMAAGINKVENHGSWKNIHCTP